jgi:hypothetical protein
MTDIHQITITTITDRPSILVHRVASDEYVDERVGEIFGIQENGRGHEWERVEFLEGEQLKEKR